MQFNFIANEPQASTSGRTLPVIDPSDGQAYDEIQRILDEDLPYISLYHRDNVAIMRKNIEGFQMYPSGFLLSVPYMTVK